METKTCAICKTPYIPSMFEKDREQIDSELCTGCYYTQKYGAFMEQHQHADEIVFDAKTKMPIEARYFPKAVLSRKIEEMIRRGNER